MTILRTLIAATALTAATSLTAPAAAAQQAGAMDESRVMAGTYETDPGHTLVQWEVSHFGFNPYYGVFGDATGTLTIDPADIEAASVEIRVPIASVAVPSAGLKDHLLRPGKDGASPDFFGPEPGMAHFKSTRVERQGANGALIYGDLTMLGRTAPIVIGAQFSGAGANPMSQARTIGFTGRARIMRSDFGVDYAIPGVGDEVDLTISAAFEKQ